MNYLDISGASSVNGKGIRTVLWVSGCNHYCKGCQNPISWDPKEGKPFTEETRKELFRLASRPVIDGLTFSGGDPMHYDNYEEVIKTAKMYKLLCPGKDIWMYTGYTHEQLKNDNERKWILDYIDVLVDGEYIADLNDGQPYRGSSNQKIIYLWR